jgi:hypothetical protein
MTRTQARLAELEAIRDRSLTPDEQAEVKRLAHLDRQCCAKRRRYASDPDYRALMKRRVQEWRFERYWSDPAWRASRLATAKVRRARQREA